MAHGTRQRVRPFQHHFHSLDADSETRAISRTNADTDSTVLNSISAPFDTNDAALDIIDATLDITDTALDITNAALDITDAALDTTAVTC